MLPAYFLGLSLGIGFALVVAAFVVFASGFRSCYDIPD